MSMKRRKRHRLQQIVRKFRDADAMLNSGGVGGSSAIAGSERIDARSLASAVQRDEVGGGGSVKKLEEENRRLRRNSTSRRWTWGLVFDRTIAGSPLK